MTNEGVYDEKMFKPELQLFSKSMKKQDFKTSNILANRIMTNAWFFDNKFYGLVGFQLRQFALDALSTSNINNTNGVKQIINETASFSDFILSLISNKKLNYKELWFRFHLQREKYRTSLAPPDEKETYPLNLDFSNLVFSKILKILEKQKTDVTILSNNLIKGILNELNRIARTYGTKINETYIWCLIIMLERVDDYIGMTAVDKEDFEIRSKNEILPLVEKVLSVYEKGTDLESVNSVLWEMIGLWRENYIRFLEPRPNIRPSVQITPKEQAKEEIIDEFVESIEGELVK